MIGIPEILIILGVVGILATYLAFIHAALTESEQAGEAPPATVDLAAAHAPQNEAAAPHSLAA